MIKPSFLNGKNKDDLAPITTVISPVAIPLQIISFFLLVILECQTAGVKPKNSVNFFSNSLFLGSFNFFDFDVPANSLILFSIAAANRDPSVFNNPDDFNIERGSKDTLAFGRGPKTCPGNHLAKRNINESIQIILERLPHLELNKIKYSDWQETAVSGWKQIFFHDPDGNIIEVHQKK